MTEDYLHYCWKFSKFSNLNFKTIDGQEVTILNKGNHNHDSGPDFLEAKIKIDDTLWAGHVEIHVNSSDFDKHKHQNDKAYNNVILHVVYNHDKDILTQNGTSIPTLELKSHISQEHLSRYENFIRHKQPILCQNSLHEVPQFVVSSWMERLILNRLESKTERIFLELEQTKGDWEEVFYRIILKYFGMKVNGDAMIDLAHILPISIIRKESNSLTKVEALFFGQAGFLNEMESTDVYGSELRSEYMYLKQKYQLYTMKAAQWRFSKLRPPNFPTIRLAQLSVLFATNQYLFQSIKDKINYSDLCQLLDVKPSEYWENHYQFGVLSKSKTSNRIGTMLLHNIVINVIVPIAFAYGQSIGDDSYKEYALDLLQNTKPEENNITKSWKTVGLPMNSAQETQASIELYTNYCAHKKCLQCQIGNFLLK
jgi:hypothetical protein